MSDAKRICLDGKWKLYYGPNEKVADKANQLTTQRALEQSGFSAIEAKVPGNFELALHENGLIDDPFFGINVLKLQEFESYHSWYCLEFDYEGVDGTETFVFEGIDTFARIYLNGVLIGETDNMLIPHEIPATSLRDGANELVVHLRPATIESRKYVMEAGTSAMRYNYDSLYVRKAPHAYGWDIMPRIVSSGIWRSVYLVQKPADRIVEAYVYTISIDRESKRARVALFYNLAVSQDSLKGYRIRFRGECGDSRFDVSHDVWHTGGRIEAHIANCKFWWPRTMGQPNLYDVTIELYKGDTVVDTKKVRTGFRTVELRRTSVTDLDGSGEFCFYINGERFFVMGTNWVPVDAFHSRDRERLPNILPMLTEIGCNAVRCWGGNVYEDDLFYDFCDENGIAVWQDFAMGCAVYPQDDQFAEKLRVEADAVIKRLRNHPSIILWAGDNEVDDAYGWTGLKRDPNDNRLTREVLPSSVRRHDPVRPYLPSSPYWDREAFRRGARYLPEQHIWGPRDYYKSPFYVNTLAHFASEVGFHGCPSPESIRKFISKEKLWPWQGNEEWLVHASSPELNFNGPYAYRIQLMANQVRELFGKVPDNLEEFALASQIAQAEAKKFLIEFFRTGKWRRTGIIWWNLIDGWPQFSDAVVDYYFNKKLAYHFIRRSQQPVCLMFREPANWRMTLVGCNETLAPAVVSYSVTDLSNGSTVAQGERVIPANGCVDVADIDYSISAKTIYLIEWTHEGRVCKNHYLSGKPAFELEWYVSLMRQADLLAGK